MDKIKEAFNKVKEDMDSLRIELNSIKSEISSLREFISLPDPSDLGPNTSTHSSTDRQTIQTGSTHSSTDNVDFKPQIPKNLGFSIRNRGVPTDRQTDQQTDRQTQNTSFESAVDIMNSLDSVKKEIRLQFKRLTDQEMLVFSTIYQLEEEKDFVDYRTVSERLGLTESSIRDYVGRLIKKGIPVEKQKINNKNIHLRVSENLKKIASLPTIMQLRDI